MRGFLGVTSSPPRELGAAARSFLSSPSLPLLLSLPLPLFFFFFLRCQSRWHWIVVAPTEGAVEHDGLGHST